MQFLLFCQHSFLSTANVSVKKYAVTRKIITFLSFFFFIITQNLHLSINFNLKFPPFYPFTFCTNINLFVIRVLAKTAQTLITSIIHKYIILLRLLRPVRFE